MFIIPIILFVAFGIIFFLWGMVESKGCNKTPYKTNIHMKKSDNRKQSYDINKYANEILFFTQERKEK